MSTFFKNQNNEYDSGHISTNYSPILHEVNIYNSILLHIFFLFFLHSLAFNFNKINILFIPLNFSEHAKFPNNRFKDA